MLIAFALIILYISSSSSALSSQQDILWARNILPESVKISAPIAEQLPRISVDQLNLPKYSLFKERGKPFILTGALDQFPAMQKWPIPIEFMNRSKSWQDPYLAQLFPRNVADFYPYNMLISESRPTLFRFARVLRELAQDSELFTDLGRNHLCPEINGCKYVHLALSARNWDRLEELGDIPKKRHAHIDSGKWWQRRCLKENDVLEEYQIKTHWRSILIGTRGSGMFNHSDSLQMSVWHAHMQGKKWWYVCSPEGSKKQKCYESVVHPGEILYYSNGWFHETRNLEFPSMTLLSAVVTKYNFERIAQKLLGECSQSNMNYRLSGKLCDALDSCYPIWHKYLKGVDAPEGKFPRWRSIASEEQQSKKDAINPMENNYDGRYWIASSLGIESWDKTLVVLASEFGRTLRSNGAGTDHGWGGNTCILGGSVRGGQILGKYPADPEIHIGNGVLVLTTPWEGLWHGISQWVGLSESSIDKVLPNRKNFLKGSYMLDKQSLFRRPNEKSVSDFRFIGDVIKIGTVSFGTTEYGYAFKAKDDAEIIHIRSDAAQIASSSIPGLGWTGMTVASSDGSGFSSRFQRIFSMEFEFSWCNDESCRAK